MLGVVDVSAQCGPDNGGEFSRSGISVALIIAILIFLSLTRREMHSCFGLVTQLLSHYWRRGQ